MDTLYESHETIDCRRISRFLSEYTVSDGDDEAKVVITSDSKGTISLGNRTMRITAGGNFGRKWVLKEDREVLLEAHRRGLRSAIEIEYGGEEFKLVRKHLMSGEFELYHNDDVVAHITKPSILRGSSEIKINSGNYDLVFFAFVFWMCEMIRSHTSVL